MSKFEAASILAVLGPLVLQLVLYLLSVKRRRELLALKHLRHEQEREGRRLDQLRQRLKSIWSRVLKARDDVRNHALRVVTQAQKGPPGQ